VVLPLSFSDSEIPLKMRGASAPVQREFLEHTRPEREKKHAPIHGDLIRARNAARIRQLEPGARLQTTTLRRGPRRRTPVRFPLTNWPASRTNPAPGLRGRQFRGARASARAKAVGDVHAADQQTNTTRSSINNAGARSKHFRLQWKLTMV